MILFIFLFGLIWTAPQTASAFPANARLGYANCQGCHIAPTGGGALNAYGRSTAHEISTWPYNDAMEEPVVSPIILGGDVRYLWTKVESPVFESQDSFLMQADFELGYTYKGFTLVGQFGQYESFPEDRQASYRHYIMYQQGQYSIRYGKFAPALGINDPDHKLPGRNGLLGFDHRSGTYNLELFYAAKRWNLNVTAVFGCRGGFEPDRSDDYCKGFHEKGYTTQVVYTPFKGLVGGVHHALLKKESEVGDGTLRTILGGSLIAGSKTLYTQAEGSVEFMSWEDPGKEPETEFEGYADFMFVPFRGLHLGYTLRQYREDSQAYGVKSVWYPAAGAELQFQWLRQFSLDQNSNSFVVVSHLYL